MLIHLTDPNDSSTKGVLDTRDPGTPRVLLDGGQGNFFIAEVLSSAEPDVLFDLAEPPSFSDEPMVWGELDEDDTLNLFLSPTTGDDTFPFARLENFRQSLDLFVQGQDSPGGTGVLTRSNQLPPDIEWALSP